MKKAGAGKASSEAESFSGQRRLYRLLTKPSSGAWEYLKHLPTTRTSGSLDLKRCFVRGSAHPPLVPCPGSSSGPVSGAAFAWPSNPGALTHGVVAPRGIRVTQADAFHPLDRGKSTCATPHAAHDRDCSHVPEWTYPDVVRSKTNPGCPSVYG